MMYTVCTAFYIISMYQILFCAMLQIGILKLVRHSQGILVYTSNTMCDEYTSMCSKISPELGDFAEHV